MPDPAPLLSPARAAVVAYAESTVGWTAPDPRYLQLVAPAETRAGDVHAAIAVALASDCILVRMGLEEAVYQVPDRARYVFGSAGTLIMHRDAKAGVYVPNPTSLTPGDGLHWAANGTAWPEHFETVVGVSRAGRVSAQATGEDAFVLEVVAGGERDAAGRETVSLLSRGVVRRAGWWVDAHNGRKLAAKVDADAMADVYPLRPVADCAS